MSGIKKQRQITQHKRFAPYGTHPNFCFAKTSFMLKTLGDMSDASLRLLQEFYKEEENKLIFVRFFKSKVLVLK